MHCRHIVTTLPLWVGYVLFGFLMVIVVAGAIILVKIAWDMFTKDDL